VSDSSFKLGPKCPACGEPWLRPTAMAGRYRCVNCLQRFELVSVCPNCGEHSTIVRMSSTAILDCNHCQGSMLKAV
jgi:ribosomal protein L37AE/L43A